MVPVKYHLTRLSRVYLGRSALDNLLPYTVVTKPPFYTSPDDLGESGLHDPATKGGGQAFTCRPMTRLRRASDGSQARLCS